MKLEAQSLPERLAHWAAWAPDAVALDDGRVALTYGELDAIARRVAARVAQAGCGRGDFVLLEAGKRALTVAALVGIQRAGAAYVPIQPKVPAERFAAALEKTGARLLIADAPDERPLPPGVAALSLEAAAAPDAPEGEVEVRVEAADPAYVLFTSGSTGLPNGVLISHGSLATFFAAVNLWMGVSVRSRCLNTSTLYFDVSVCDTLLPLYCGATVYLTSDTLLPQRLVALIEQKRINTMAAVGSTLALVAQTPGFSERRWPDLHSVMTGAEVLNPTAIKAWLAVAPNAHVFNGYGPTEATCCTSIHVIHPGNANVAEYPIGQPLPGFEIALGSFEREAAPGEAAELLLAGAQVMDGYIGDEDLTARKIVQEGGRRAYRTGDLVRLEGGSLRFLGRSDDTVKVRGYRVNLSDVAHQFRALPEVVDAVAARLVHDRWGEILCVCVEARAGAVESISRATLEAVAAERLPGYMRPRLYAVLPTFPHKSSGKVDVKGVRARLVDDLKDADEGLHALDVHREPMPVGDPS